MYPGSVWLLMEGGWGGRAKVRSSWREKDLPRFEACRDYIEASIAENY